MIGSSFRPYPFRQGPVFCALAPNGKRPPCRSCTGERTMKGSALTRWPRRLDRTAVFRLLFFQPLQTRFYPGPIVWAELGALQAYQPRERHK